MNINYKITTVVLAVLLVLTVGWCWQTVLVYRDVAMKSEINNQTDATNMHMMPDGTMMVNSDETMMDMTMNDMVKDLQGKTGKDLEKAFIMGMIPHHQGAVDMAKLLLQDKTINANFVKFGNDIITAQEGEIKMMQEWLKDF